MSCTGICEIVWWNKLWPELHGKESMPSSKALQAKTHTYAKYFLKQLTDKAGMYPILEHARDL